MNGFFISGLYLKGLNVETASVTFKKGANLITGASDTGKSYVFAGLNYALGIGDPPKGIDQSVGYQEILIVIVTYDDNKSYTLRRELGKSVIYVKECTFEEFYTKAIPYKKFLTTGALESDEHISSLLLRLMGLNNQKILVSKDSGTTTNITLRNILNFTFIAEDTIIKLNSPFYFSLQNKERILAQSLLTVLLSGEDFSSVIEKEDLSIKENQILGKLEFLNYQVTQFALDKLMLLEKTTSNVFISEKQKFLELDANLQANISQANELIRQKNVLIEEKQKFTNDLSYRQELIHRFEVLAKQYNSDSDRLDFILESHVISSQLGDIVCPLCSSPLDDDHIIHIKERENFLAAASNELLKIQSKLLGLTETSENLKKEEKSILKEIEIIEKQFENLEANLNINFSTKIQDLKKELSEYIEIESFSREVNFVDVQLTKLGKEKDRLERLLNAKNPAEEEVNLVAYPILMDLCWFIEQRLRNWNYEKEIKVGFDSHYFTFDITISGKARKSYGKGKRSISFAACLVGLLDYCHANNRNFSNLIVLDSPLTTFEEKKGTSNEAVQSEVLKSFFNDIVNLPSGSQLIMLDNKTPDKETFDSIKDKLHMVTFTGTKDFGREGFFPY